MIYRNQKTKNISFPLGGIGTGSIGLTGNGELQDWEIFNRPNKNTRNGYSHFAIKATVGTKSIVKVLHGDTNENYMGTPCKSATHTGYGYGPRENSMAGFPHFQNVSFDGFFPIAKLTFCDEDFPAIVRLCAFNPFIPHDEFNSSLPAAFFEWEIENTSDETVEFALAGTLHNPAEKAENQKIGIENMQGIIFREAAKNDTEIGYTDLCLLTDEKDTAVQEYWYRGRWKDGCTVYWKNLLELDRMPDRHYNEPNARDHGSVVTYLRISPKERKRVRFILAWNSPIAHNYWTRPKNGEEPFKPWRNYYATVFKDSSETATYALRHYSELYEKTALFTDSLQACTMSESVKDAVSANLSVLKSPTVLRLEDGSFWGWEGCTEIHGSCCGTCQHVWNYAYALPYLFPRLERSIRENNLKYALQENGATTFRLNLPPTNAMTTERACLDGQMGEVIKCYREWKLSGDTEWLKNHAESIFKMLEYAWSPSNPDKWDADMDGVLEGRQHHTLDMELFGPNAWLEGFYLLALDCGAKMARALGESARSALYEDLYRRGKAWTNEHLFNGRYFSQKVDLTDISTLERFNAVASYWNDEAKEIKYQVADGCIIDQMLADWHAVLIGAEEIFDNDKKKTALKNLYQNNFKSSMRDVTNMWRNFALNDESGTVICTYPDGVQVPAIPIPYCEECMTGFEYALAGLMIAEGYEDEGETMVKAIRDRYDGEKRNPWNEIECGSNYARSMASYALMAIYSGFTFDMTEKHISFKPLKENGKYLFSVAESWGTVEFNKSCTRLSICGNPLLLSSVTIPHADQITSVILDGKKIPFKAQNGKIFFQEITVKSELSFA